MPYGSSAKILRVNLTTGVLSIEELSEEFYRLYPGGKSLAGYYLLNEMPAHTDPFGPESVLVVANGLLTGSPVSTATRYVVSARSPLTNGYGESEAGGFWGPELKMAGFEALVITGCAPKPVYLWIQDGAAELRSAEHLWGRDPLHVQTTIREELGDDKIRVMQIGVAGENRVLYASITNDLRHFNGRTAWARSWVPRTCGRWPCAGTNAIWAWQRMRLLCRRSEKSCPRKCRNTPAVGICRCAGRPGWWKA